MEQEHRTSDGSWRPIPDPTLLTTEQLHREIAALRELFKTRLDAGDEAVRLLQATAFKSPTIAEVVAEFREKFRGIDAQFTERDVRARENKADGKLMVDAAFAAQKEAVAEQNKSFAASTTKSEAATTKQIDATTTLVQSTASALSGKIDDIKERLTSLEGLRNGEKDTQASGTARQQWHVGILVAIAIGLMSLAIQLLRH